MTQGQWQPQCDKNKTKDRSINIWKGSGRCPFHLTPSEAQFCTPKRLPPLIFAENDPQKTKTTPHKCLNNPQMTSSTKFCMFQTPKKIHFRPLRNKPLRKHLPSPFSDIIWNGPSVKKWTGWFSFKVFVISLMFFWY